MSKKGHVISTSQAQRYNLKPGTYVEVEMFSEEELREADKKIHGISKTLSHMTKNVYLNGTRYTGNIDLLD